MHFTSAPQQLRYWADLSELSELYTLYVETGYAEELDTKFIIAPLRETTEQLFGERRRLIANFKVAKSQDAE